MADNSILPASGETIATKDNGSGVKFQEVVQVDTKYQPVNPATSDEQGILKRILNALLNPPWVDKSANQLRAQVTGSATVTFAANQDLRNVTGTIAAVTSVTNQVSMDGYQGKMLPIGQNMAAWAVCVRNRIT
jgi:hypothetical protein